MVRGSTGICENQCFRWFQADTPIFDELSSWRCCCGSHQPENLRQPSIQPSNCHASSEPKEQVQTFRQHLWQAGCGIVKRLVLESRYQGRGQLQTEVFLHQEIGQCRGKTSSDPTTPRMGTPVRLHRCMITFLVRLRAFRPKEYFYMGISYRNIENGHDTNPRAYPKDRGEM